MNVLLTLDYELFFGRSAGTPENCLLRPVDALLAVLARRGDRACFFVDATYLAALERWADRRPGAARELDRVAAHVRNLHEAGHDVQLHVHPHWEDAEWTDAGWRHDVRRFRLHQFPGDRIAEVVARSRDALARIVGDGVFVFRAGGWCLQPFGPLARPLLDAGIRVDSTVFRGGLGRSASHAYDFRAAPEQTAWRFGADPLVPDPDGAFVEVPIASQRVGPALFWRLAAAKKLGSARHAPFGDGVPVRAGGRRDLVRMLLWPSVSVVSMDGVKARCLTGALRRHVRRHPGPDENFVVIGHPKALTPASLALLDRFLGGVHRDGHRVVTYASHPAGWGRPAG